MVDIQIRELSDLDELAAAAELLRRIWRADSADQIVNAGMMRAFAHSGNYVAGAYRGAELIGVGVGFLGAGHLHSHVTGVVSGGQGAGVGYALKLHQRAWALARGIDAICWTFDPLVRRNAYFNLAKLGARATAYLPDFYGPMDDGVNARDASDRLYVRWELAAPVGAPEVDHRGAAVLLGRAGGDVPVPAAGSGPRLLIAVPADVEQMRRVEPGLAARWRIAVREAMTGALGDGYQIIGVTRDGWYVLIRP
ncbi:GNAT family N-acetyltransferase [Actinomycetes bacterium KLBMP 9797]